MAGHALRAFGGPTTEESQLTNDKRSFARHAEGRSATGAPPAAQDDNFRFLQHLKRLHKCGVYTKDINKL